MKIDFTTPIQTLDGKPILNNPGNQPATLKTITTDALLASFEDEKNITGEEKLKRYLLATRIYANPQNIDLTVEETALIKKLIGKGFGPLIVGQAYEIIESKQT